MHPSSTCSSRPLSAARRKGDAYRRAFLVRVFTFSLTLIVYMNLSVAHAEQEPGAAVSDLLNVERMVESDYSVPSCPAHVFK